MRFGWQSEAAKSLMSQSGLDDPVQAMRAKANELLKEIKFSHPPVNLELAASFRGINKIVKVKAPYAAALIPMPQGNGFIIQVNAEHSRGRQNFSICHELGHTFLPDYTSSPVFRQDETTGEYGIEQEEEYLCDVAAAEILMPMKSFKPLAQKKGASIETIVYLANLFKSSLEATAIRLVQTEIWRLAAVIWEKGLKPSQELLKDQPSLPGFEFKPEEKLRVKFAVTSKINFFIPKYKSIDARSSIYRCYIEGGKTAGFESWEIGGKEYSFRAESIAINYINEGRRERKVLSLLFP